MGNQISHTIYEEYKYLKKYYREYFQPNYFVYDVIKSFDSRRHLIVYYPPPLGSKLLIPYEMICLRTMRPVKSVQTDNGRYSIGQRIHGDLKYFQSIGQALFS